MSGSPALVWFRRDLRVADQPTFLAVGENRRALALFVLDPRLLAPAGAARQRWEEFLHDHLDEYADGRDRPDQPGTSRMSVYLKYGCVHPRTLLVDGDLASNQHGWQWVAGSGTDAAPYFRVFNPVLQGERFDPNGDYVRKYVPELVDVAGKVVHQPWKLPDGPPAGYPAPVVDHKHERAVALDRYEAVKDAKRGATAPTEGRPAS